MRDTPKETACNATHTNEEKMTTITLHNHRSSLVGKPERRFGKLWHAVLEHVFKYDLQAAAEALTVKKTVISIKQLLEQGYLDRVKFYEELIRFACELLQGAKKAIRVTT